MLSLRKESFESNSMMKMKCSLKLVRIGWMILGNIFDIVR